MKCILCVAIYICVFSKLVNGARINKPNKMKEIITLEVDSDTDIYGPDNNYLEEGIKKIITCKGSQKYQKIEWYDPEGNLVGKKDLSSEVYVLEPSLSRVPTLNLVFENTKQSQSGVWECRSGEMVQKVTLCIMDPAEFVNAPNEITIDEGRSITLSCEPAGSPEPKIQWYRDGQLIVEDSEKYFTMTKFNLHGYEGLLTIKSLAPEDMGVYVCEAVQENPRVEDCNNTITTNITLNVNHAPSFREEETDDPKNISVYIYAQDDENVTLNCDPSAFPPPEFRWFSGNMAIEYKNFKVIENDEEPRKRVSSTFVVIANPSTFNHAFKCKTKNAFGESFLTFNIAKLQKPGKLSATYEFVPRQRTIHFNVTTADVEENTFPLDGIDIQYFEKTIKGEPSYWQWESAKTIRHVNHVDDGEIYVVPLKQLKLNTEYWARLRGYNELGKGPWSNHMLISTTYEAPHTASFDIGIFLGVVVFAVVTAFAAACITVIKRI